MVIGAGPKRGHERAAGRALTARAGFSTASRPAERAGRSGHEGRTRHLLPSQPERAPGAQYVRWSATATWSSGCGTGTIRRYGRATTGIAYDDIRAAAANTPSGARARDPMEMYDLGRGQTDSRGRRLMRPGAEYRIYGRIRGSVRTVAGACGRGAPFRSRWGLWRMACPSSTRAIRGCGGVRVPWPVDASARGPRTGTWT
jgi:hypothetical protein